uniref:30S ribosomal protein S1 n=1 Tax=Porolithon onkodes TaxID=231751 RepID=A0A2Z2KS02_9FLOR|nr:30S ribosomal protein S1 [Porolithon onkodes]ASB29666.1 30S ribosomal protein S1 [Porolithon onkodes]
MNREIQKKKHKLFTHKDFASLLNRYQYKLNIGDITAGTIFSKEKKGFLVDIGEPIMAYLPIDEISIKKFQETFPHINNSREFFILAYSKKSKQLILSIKRLEYIRGWQRIKQVQLKDVTNYLYVEKVNRGGLITNIEGIQGFIPNSHISNINLKQSFLHTKIKCKILLTNNKTNTIIFSHKRAYLLELLSKIYIGQIISGTITKIQKYGLFVNIYNFLALLHISEIGTENFNNLNLFYIGNIIKVQIIHIDTKQGRISVSRKYIKK